MKLFFPEVTKHGEAVAADISGAPEPKRPKSTPLLPPVAYSKEQAIYLATAGFAIAVSTFGQSIVGQYGSPIKKSFDLTDKNFTNMLSVMRAGALVALVAGGLADRFGRRRVILYSLLAMAGANLLSTFAPDAVTLTVLQTLARGFATAAGIVAAVGALEDRFAIRQVLRLIGLLRRAHRLDIEADTAVVAGAFEHPHRVEGAAEIDAAEGFVLIVFQTVLIVEMDAP